MSDTLEARELLVNVEGDLKHRRWVVNTAVDRIERFDSAETPAAPDDAYAQVADLAQYREAKENDQPSTENGGLTPEIAELSARAAELATPSIVRPAA